MNPENKNLLIVGAGGFIGGFLVREALARGYRVWAGVRPSTSRRFLSDPAINFLVFDDFESSQSVAATLRSALPDGAGFDYIVYNLGATKCTNFADFNRINFGFLRSFVRALELNRMSPERFVYMSSLSAIGKGDEKNYTPFNNSMVPDPDTRYGLSKIKAEMLLEMTPWLHWTIMRPTGVYGPHEHDYLMMIKAIARHIDFGVGFRRQMLTFIYVEDLARAVFDAIASPDTLRRRYILSEKRAYSQAEFRRIVAEELGTRFVIPVRLPIWATYLASFIAEKYGVLTLKPSTLNRDKFRIMKQRNWTCDVSDAVRDFGFNPQVDLRSGIRRTIQAYRDSQQ